jgi:hypothetical protein
MAALLVPLFWLSATLSQYQLQKQWYFDGRAMLHGKQW